LVARRSWWIPPSPRSTGLSVSYPADRWLQENEALACGLESAAFSILSCGSLVARAGAADRGRPAFAFQYPILRIVGCKSLPKCWPAWGRPRLSVSYPADRWLQAVGLTWRGFLLTGLSVSYPADRWLQAASFGLMFTLCSLLSVSYPADRWLQGRRQAGPRLAGEHHFQYPILRIVGCKTALTRPAAPSVPSFSILSCGSLVARVSTSALTS